MHNDSTPKHRTHVHTRVRSDSKTGILGVQWAERQNRYRARVTLDRKRITLGFFRTIEEAADAVAKARAHLKPREKPPKIKQPKKVLTAEERRERGRQTVKRHYAKRRAWYAEFMKDRVCEKCGTNELRLDWHHRDPTSKKFPVGRGVCTLPIPMILAEIEKCSLLCVKCHWDEHRRLRRLA